MQNRDTQIKILNELIAISDVDSLRNFVYMHKHYPDLKQIVVDFLFENPERFKCVINDLDALWQLLDICSTLKNKDNPNAVSMMNILDKLCRNERLFLHIFPAENKLTVAKKQLAGQYQTKVVEIIFNLYHKKKNEEYALQQVMEVEAESCQALVVDTITERLISLLQNQRIAHDKVIEFLKNLEAYYVKKPTAFLRRSQERLLANRVPTLVNICCNFFAANIKNYPKMIGSLPKELTERLQKRSMLE